MTFACSALEKDEYNHITATYYLLAEKRLRGRRLESLKKNLPAGDAGRQAAGSTTSTGPRRRSIADSRSDSVCSLVKTKSAENILSDDDGGGGVDARTGCCEPASSLDDLDALKAALRDDPSPPPQSSSSSTASSPARTGRDQTTAVRITNSGSRNGS